jgi:cell volume regulation protein A
MDDSVRFGALVLATAVAGLLAVQSHRLSERLRVPTPAFFLVAAAIAGRWVPEPHHQTVERVVTVALVVILFDGGLHIGAARFRSAAGGILALGVVGTFVTVAGAALLAHALLDVNWYLSALLATAVAPTDPAVVFSVLGQREIEGRTGTLLEGESGANDPVGIALMAGLLGAGSLSGSALGHVAGTFALQMAVGTGVGLVGGRLLLQLMRRVALPSEGLYSVRVLLAAGAIFGLASLLHGSGFLAVFVTGMLLGDERAPYKREIERFHAALASLGEVVAFAFFGLTVDPSVLSRADVWLPGLALGVALAVVLRPLLVGPLLLSPRLFRPRLRKREAGFVLLSGLKGAVPLLLGSLLLPEDHGARLYGVVTVVVLVSVVAQGTMVPTMARLLGVRMRTVEPEPFSLGVRFRDEPRGAYRVRVSSGSVAEGCAIADVPGLAEGTWVSLVLRDGAIVPVRGDTVLEARDDVLLLVDEKQDPVPLLALFANAVAGTEG